LWTNPGGQRGRGRPKSRWTDGVDKNTRKLAFRNWQTTAQGRGRWRHLLQEAKVHPGLDDDDDNDDNDDGCLFIVIELNGQIMTPMYKYSLLNTAH
jgi:hypothetical protein